MGAMGRSSLPETLHGIRAWRGIWRRDSAADVRMQQESSDAVVLFTGRERNPHFRFGAAAHPMISDLPHDDDVEDVPSGPFENEPVASPEDKGGTGQRLTGL